MAGDSTSAIRTKPLKGFGRLGKWLNGLLADTHAIEPRAGSGITESQSPSGKTLNATAAGGGASGTKATYYVVKDGKLYTQVFIVSGDPVLVT